MTMDQSSEHALPLDGNAAGGLLRELFALDLTAANITCGGCDTVAGIGEVRLYAVEMGAVLRCANCDTAMLRLTHTPAGLWLDMRGARTLFVAAPA
jgi:Family of unknown function (DUF6510)